MTATTGLYALINDRVQVCYAAVADSQERDYSQADDKVFTVELSSFLDLYLGGQNPAGA